jgi:hypothetical protein
MLAWTLIPSWWSSLGVTFSTVHWPACVWLERNFTFFSAVSAGCLVRLCLIHYAFSTPVYWLTQKHCFCDYYFLQHHPVLNLCTHEPVFDMILMLNSQR